MNFNIRKLKIKISHKQRALNAARPGSTWTRLRGELKALELALVIARQTAAQNRKAA